MSAGPRGEMPIELGKRIELETRKGKKESVRSAENAEERNRRGEEERECVRGYSERKMRSRERGITREVDRKRANRLKECERRNLWERENETAEQEFPQE